MECNSTADEEIELQLPNSGLYVTDDFLIKKDPKNHVTGKYRLRDIKELKLRRELDGSSLVFCIIGGCGIYFPYIQMVDNIWRWLIIGFSALFLLVDINSFRKTLIVIKFREDFLNFDLKEEFNVGKGFIVAVNAKIRGHL